MKIVSLLPSATEIVFALGLGHALEGVTFECDYPPEARSKPVVCTAASADDVQLTAREIDERVTAKLAQGEPIYRLDARRISSIDPDLILTQDLCRVCAVATGDVQGALDLLGCRAEIVSLDPATLDDVIACIGAVGDATGTAARAEMLMEQLRERVAAVREGVASRERPRTFALEWSDPPFSGGHWVPDMIEAAGGEAILATAGTPSRRLRWDEVADQAPEVVMFMPCGYDLSEAMAEGHGLLDVAALAGSAQIYAVDANAYFSRPGPRVIDGVEAIAWVLHPQAVPKPPSGIIRALRP